MQCCSPSQFAPQQNNDALLRQILKNTEDIKKALGVFPVNVTIFDANEDKEEAQSQTIQIGSVSQGISRSIERIEKISKIIGIDVFPLKLPASLIEKVDSNVMDIVFDWFTPDEIRVNNVMSLLVYTLKYLDGVIGKWQQKIHIEDADAVKEGKQPKDVVLPDIANTLREITSVSTANHKALGLITDVCVKIITEVCNAKLDVAKTKLIVRDIQQFLSYTSRELAIEVPLSINIPDLQEVTITGNESEEERKVLEAQKKQMDALKNDLSKYLQPGTCKVVYEDWDGNKSLTDYFLHLATLMATARGQNG
jgi:23S rRNA U2552 (ribose-2'-O)-methylase RlmE/FtsJ